MKTTDFYNFKSSKMNSLDVENQNLIHMICYQTFKNLNNEK